MGEHNIPKPARRVSAAVVPLLGLIAVVAGCVLAWNTSASETFGWFAYAPLSNQAFTVSGGVFLNQGTQTGLIVAVLGLLVLAFWAGHRLGRQRPAVGRAGR